MKTIAAIVEGYGDCQAVPHLISKLGNHFGEHIFANNPIRAGEWPKLRRPGELERALELANSRSCNSILVLLDLDDDCAASESTQAMTRVQIWKNGRNIDINIVFFVREYETLFLSCADVYCDESDIVASAIATAEQVRDAKGAIKRLIGRRYKETQEQVEFTKRLDMAKLIERSRCFRKLVKVVIGKPYEAF